MSAVAAKPTAGGAVDMTAMIIGLIILLVVIAATYFVFGSGLAFMALIGIIVGGILIGFGVHFVPVGGAPAAMGQAPGIATGVAMLAAGAGLAGCNHPRLAETHRPGVKKIGLTAVPPERSVYPVPGQGR